MNTTKEKELMNRELNKLWPEGWDLHWSQPNGRQVQVVASSDDPNESSIMSITLWVPEVVNSAGYPEPAMTDGEIYAAIAAEASRRQ